MTAFARMVRGGRAVRAARATPVGWRKRAAAVDNGEPRVELPPTIAPVLELGRRVNLLDGSDF